METELRVKASLLSKGSMKKHTLEILQGEASTMMTMTLTVKVMECQGATLLAASQGILYKETGNLQEDFWRIIQTSLKIYWHR